MQLVDYVEDNIKVTVKPYLIGEFIDENQKYKNSWFEDYATTIIMLRPIQNLDSFEAVISKSRTEQLMEESQLVNKGKAIVDSLQISLMSNNFENTDEISKTIHQLVFKINISGVDKYYFVSMEENLDEDSETKINNINFKNMVVNTKKTQVFHLTSEELIKQQFKGMDILWIDDALKVENLYEWLSNWQTHSEKEFELTTSNGVLIDSIKADTWNNINLEVEINNSTPKLFPFKWTPLIIDNEVHIKANWFDYNLVLPYKDALKYSGSPVYFDNIFPNDANPDQETQNWIHLIHDLILVSYLFRTQFRDIPRLQPSSSNPNAQGQIDPKYTLGELPSKSPLHIINIANENPVQVADYLYKQFKANNTNTSIENEYAFNRIVAALSNYIYSPKSIAQGIMPLNEVILPWYLTANESIGILLNGNNYTLDSGKLKWTIASKFFDVKNDFIPILNPTLSELKTIFTDRQNVIYPLKNIIIPSHQTNNPSLMAPSTTTNKGIDTKYISWIPLNDKSTYDKLMMGADTTSVTDEYRTFTLPSINQPFQFNYQDLDNNIINYVKNVLYKDPNINVQIIYRGDRVDSQKVLAAKFSGQTDLGASPVTPPLPSNNDLYAIAFINIMSNPSVHTINYEVGLPSVGNDFQIQKTLSLGTVYNNSIISIGEQQEHIWRASFDVMQINDSYNNVKVHVTNITPHDAPVTFNRKNIFTKEEFKKEIMKYETGYISNKFSINKPQKDTEFYRRVHSITINAIFTDIYIFTINSLKDPLTIDINSINNKDQTITQQKIIFV